jgi:shikimate kinase
VATLLEVAFADSDQLIEAQVGRSVQQIFRADGEAEFRVIEAGVIADALVNFDGILALGGGAVLTESTRQALDRSAVPVVLLRSSIRTLVRRVGDGNGRPLLSGEPRRKLIALASAREPVYRSVATLVVDTDRRSSGRVAAEIVQLLAQSALTS